MSCYPVFKSKGDTLKPKIQKEITMNTISGKQTGKTILIGLVAASLVTIGSYQAFAKRHGGQGGYYNQGECGMMTGQMQRGPQGRSALGLWKNPVVIEELGLSDEQVNKLKEADFAAREKQIGLQGELEAVRLNMQKTFSADPVDKEAALKFAQEKADIKSKMSVQRVESRLLVREILTSEQLDKLKQLRMEYRGGKHQRGKGFGMRSGNGQGPGYLNSIEGSTSASS